MPLRSIENLLAEHREVEKVLADLEGLLDDFLTNAEVPDSSKQALRDIADFLARGLILHIKKEDDGLFPALEKFLPRGAGPLAVMLEEHREITQLYLGLRDGVAGLDQSRATSAPSAVRIRDNGRPLIHLLRAHLSKEERILFPFAEGHLSEEDDRRILEKYDEIVAHLPAGEQTRQ